MTGRRAPSTPHARGQGLVEFALIFPVIIVMLFGLIDGSRLVYSYSTLTNAVRTGVRVAIVDQNRTRIDAAIIANAVALGLTSDNIDYVGYKSIEGLRPSPRGVRRPPRTAIPSSPAASRSSKPTTTSGH